jgi:hypothetical protein
MENYFASQRDHIFRNVEVLIYVFDVESREVQYGAAISGDICHMRHLRYIVKHRAFDT